MNIKIVYFVFIFIGLLFACNENTSKSKTNNENTYSKPQYIDNFDNYKYLVNNNIESIDSLIFYSVYAIIDTDGYYSNANFYIGVNPSSIVNSFNINDDNYPKTDTITDKILIKKIITNVFKLRKNDEKLIVSSDYRVAMKIYSQNEQYIIGIDNQGFSVGDSIYIITTSINPILKLIEIYPDLKYNLFNDSSITIKYIEINEE